MQTCEPRLAIVTGAGGELGRAFCLRLAAVGDYHIVAIDADEARGEETLKQIRAVRTSPLAGEFVRMDVADRAAWQQLATRVAADLDDGKYSGPDLLINNAGVCAAAEAIGGDADHWRRLMDVNYFGVLNGCQAMGPLWVKDGRLRPRIINVASIFGLLPTPSLSAYSASKAAVVALSEALAAELRPVGVPVTIVAPGFFQSGLVERGEFASDQFRAEAEHRSQDATFTADDVAREALAASARGQLYCVMGARARWLWRLKRLAPRTLHRLISRSYHSKFSNLNPEP